MDAAGDSGLQGTTTAKLTWSLLPRVSGLPVVLAVLQWLLQHTSGRGTSCVLDQNQSWVDSHTCPSAWTRHSTEPLPRWVEVLSVLLPRHEWGQGKDLSTHLSPNQVTTGDACFPHSKVCDKHRHKNILVAKLIKYSTITQWSQDVT